MDADNFARIRQFWTTDFDDSDGSSMLEVQEDYFGDYPDTADLPKKRSGRGGNILTRRRRRRKRRRKRRRRRRRRAALKKEGEERREIVNGIKDGIRDELLRVCM